MALVGSAAREGNWHRRFGLPRRKAPRFLFELAILLTGLLSYHLVRGAVDGRVEEALSNAAALIRVEQSLGIFWEVHLQGLILGHRFLVDIFNWVYIWGHIPIIALLGLWIFAYRRDSFARYRNAFLLSGAIGLIFFALLPTAPPRFIDEAGLVDTVTLHSSAYRVLQPPALVNQYAAMPSLHFGWNLLVAIALLQTTRSRLARGFGLLMPALMFVAVVLTANHYILDPIVGGIIALGSLWVAGLLHDRLSATRAHAVFV